ncbi:thiamine biosynthesis lipoprotein [Sphingomonas naasensis]|uniref:FAD:protein FMN transferase n=1 Tax=Sphingomonas naasensis TaxID=1344951 RepID=A0A4S1WCL9_9SPHN|nr:FAD:protein FMN transferase [Sphingomonas naasensis]NIJ22300.1 thiamine biosynthesis lipoprotein [Sphingomonas naasensis]TGX40694.1 FAD:protein FMN transferase [Sphingomonas naasensis]
MGTTWSVRIAALPERLAPAIAPAVQTVLDRVIAQMSQWEPGSDLSRFNRATPGSGISLPAEFAHVLGAALDVAARSGGAFDPAMGALADQWGFGPSGRRVGIPPAVPGGERRIDFEPLLLRARRSAAAALDFSGIAKGYAVDAVAAALRAHGLDDFLVEIGGELSGHGIKPDGQPWWVDLEQAPGAAVAPIRVALHGLAIATSGDYRRHFEEGGRRYAHTLDPRSGAPLDNGVASVTVLHAECMRADAWATALSVLGPEAAPAVAAREGLAMHMVVRAAEGPREILSPAFAAMLG